MKKILKSNVLALQLNSGIWAHTMQEFGLLSSLDPETHTITLMKCGGLQTSGCIVRESKGRSLGSFTRTLDCKNCSVASTSLESRLRRLGFDVISVDLARWSLPEDIRESQSFIPAVWQDSQVSQIAYRGIPVGRIAFYEWYLNSKSISLNYNGLSTERMDRRGHSLQNVMLVLLALERYLKNNTEAKISTAICYAPQYSINNAALRMLREYHPEVKQFFVEGSFHPDRKYKSLQVWDWQKFGLVPPEIQSPSGIEAQRARIDQFAEGFMSSLSAASSFMVYSKSDTSVSKSRILSRIGFESKSRIILVALSSIDEVAAATGIGAMSEDFYPGSVFESQYKMCEYLVERIGSLPDHGLILRIHPREFAESRNRNSSQSLEKWEELAESFKGSTYLNTPDDPWSLGDLIKSSDTVVTGWSSAAIQSALMGKHTVSYDRKMGFFSKEAISTGESVEEFDANLFLNLSEEQLANRRDRAAEWIWKNYFLAEIDAPSSARLYVDFLRKNDAMRKALFALEELSPRLVRLLDLRLAGRPSVENQRRVRRLFDDGLDYPPLRTFGPA